MMADEIALVLVLPDDTIDTIIQKIRDGGTTTVELLVPDGVAALQTPEELQALNRSITSEGIKLLLISSDEQTLAAARQSEVETVGVSGARVQLPPVLPSGNGGKDRPVGRRTEQAPSLASMNDEEFLRSLDTLSAPPTSHNAPTMSGDADILAALDNLTETAERMPHRAAAEEPYDDFASELDAWGDLSSGAATAETINMDTATGQADSPSAQSTRPRIRPEDIELTDEEKRRASRVTSAPARPRRESAAAHPAPVRRPASYDDEDDEYEKSGGRLNRIVLIAIALIILLAIIGGVLMFGNRATVSVQLPSSALQEQPFEAQTIPLLDASASSSEAATAVRATVITGNVVYTATGQISRQTQAPADTARGTVIILSQNVQPIEFPAGTEFVAVNGAGQEVRFFSENPIVLPPSTTARQGAQIITTLGQAEVNVTARAPGSAANVAANTITQIVVPGQSPINVNAGNIFIEHGPITGGTEKTVWVVTDEEVQRLLGEALTGLYNQANTVLADQSAALDNLTLESTTISPAAEDLSAGQGYEYTTSPPVGQAVDENNTTFTLVVQSRFSALATPPGERNALDAQLQSVVPLQLDQVGALSPGMAPAITNWRWDGERLTVGGLLRPAGNNLDNATRNAIVDSIKGKSSQEARAALDNFVQQEVISSYTLPERDALPGWGFQIDLRVEPFGAPEG
ncbi:MAG: hypothetical protein MI924_27780 [Chloroflexales bacterium]|nr:hypothetical protein [Chloroflexales bacterium]